MVVEPLLPWECAGTYLVGWKTQLESYAGHAEYGHCLWTDKFDFSDLNLRDWCRGGRAGGGGGGLF